MNRAACMFVTSLAIATMLALTGCGGSQASSTTSPQASSSAATAISSGAAAGANASSASSADAPGSHTPQAVNYIGEDAAKAAALKHAGIPETSCNNLTIELDAEAADGSAHYDIAFNCNGLAYDYDIDATTGAVLTFESEIDNPDTK